MGLGVDLRVGPGLVSLGWARGQRRGPKLRCTRAAPRPYDARPSAHIPMARAFDSRTNRSTKNAWSHSETCSSLRHHHAGLRERACVCLLGRGLAWRGSARVVCGAWCARVWCVEHRVWCVAHNAGGGGADGQRGKGAEETGRGGER